MDLQDKDKDFGGERAKTVLIDVELLAQLFKTGSEHHFRIVDGLPEDARITAARVDPDRAGVVALTVFSKSFDFVPNGFALPSQSVVAERIGS